MTATLTLSQRLVEAEQAYHDLVRGAKPSVVVDQNGERVEYQHANIAALRAYIRDLREQIAAANGNATPRGPMQVFM